jgi:hypothetical protein
MKSIHENDIQKSIQWIRLTMTLCLMALSVLYPTFFQHYMATPISALLITLFGIPHGANDEWLYVKHSMEYSKHSQSLPQVKVKFQRIYLSIAFVWALLWIWTPVLAFWAFILVSCYHFGEVI